jgi:hypothetical protein
MKMGRNTLIPSPCYLVVTHYTGQRSVMKRGNSLPSDSITYPPFNYNLYARLPGLFTSRFVSSLTYIRSR